MHLTSLFSVHSSQNIALLRRSEAWNSCPYWDGSVSIISPQKATHQKFRDVADFDFGLLGSSAGVIYVERKKGSSTVDTLKHFASGIRATKVLLWHHSQNKTKSMCSKVSWYFQKEQDRTSRNLTCCLSRKVLFIWPCRPKYRSSPSWPWTIPMWPTSRTRDSILER